MQFIVEDIAKKGLSVRKVAENEYEILYKGKVLKTGKDYEAGAFLRKYFWKSAKSTEELLNQELLNVLRKLETFTISRNFKGVIYEMTKKGNTIIWKFADDLSTFPNRADLSEDGFISFNFRIPDRLLKKPYGGFGQKFLDESFEIFDDSINGAEAYWAESPQYPGGSSLGYKQFYETFNKTKDEIKSLKSTKFYEIMNKKGISKITKESVDIGEYDDVSIIIYKKNFK